MGSAACVKELINPTNKDIKGCDCNARSKGDSKAKDVADNKVLKILEEEKRLRGQGLDGPKEDVVVDDDDDIHAKAHRDIVKAERKKAPGGKGHQRHVRRARKALMNAWGEESLKMHPPASKNRGIERSSSFNGSSNTVPRAQTAPARRNSLFLKDPRELSAADKTQRLERLFSDASSSVRDFMITENDKKVSGHSRLDQKKKDLALRENLMRDMVRNSPEPTVYSLIWKYETHSSRPFDSEVSKAFMEYLSTK